MSNSGQASNKADINLFHRAKIEKLVEPIDGLNFCYKDRFWIVTPEEEILFYNPRKRKYSYSMPQCNAAEAIAIRIRDKMFPDFEVRHIPLIFVPDSARNYR